MNTLLTSSEIEQIYIVLTQIDRDFIRRNLAQGYRNGGDAAGDIITVSSGRIRDYLSEVGIYKFNLGSLSPSKGEGLKLYERNGEWHFSYFERGVETTLHSHQSMESVIEARIAQVKSELTAVIGSTVAQDELRRAGEIFRK
jgi:hypothetical protein